MFNMLGINANRGTAPHVGHLYNIVLTDILKRWQVLKGKRAILCTGTDEHGMKVSDLVEVSKKKSLIELLFFRSNRRRRRQGKMCEHFVIKAISLLRYAVLCVEEVWSMLITIDTCRES